MACSAVKITLAILKKGYYEINGKRVNIRDDIEHTNANVEFWTTNQLRSLSECTFDIRNNATRIEVTKETTLEAARRLKYRDTNVGILNFALGNTVAGGFSQGHGGGQEESLCRSTGLYLSLSQRQVKQFYSDNCKSNEYGRNQLIYSPDVVVFKDDEGNLLESSYKIDIVSCPAVYASNIKKEYENTNEIIEAVMFYRMNYLLAFFASKNITSLVLGGYGCGIFGNDCEIIASLFNNLLTTKYRDVFKCIIFAIRDHSKGQTVYKAFKLKLTGGK